MVTFKIVVKFSCLKSLCLVHPLASMMREEEEIPSPWKLPCAFWLVWSHRLRTASGTRMLRWSSSVAERLELGRQGRFVWSTGDKAD